MSLNKLLMATAGFLFVAIIVITAVSLTSQRAEPGKNLVKISQAQEMNKAVFTPAVTPENTTFTKIGQLRISTRPDKDQKRTVLVVSPVLEYKAEDDTFYEELNSRLLQIKDLINEYFSSMTAEQINERGEDRIKQELLNLINSVLVLQKIQKIYFNDFQFI